ncbi:MAG: tRNA (adenosine(37)-N6)-threonylcarbamoyltransferase complex ATPase subunit type 1 TsaE [Alphaproteobacteria bacterium]|nr:tRNA (adenosine(37)-N6)-threonylcarbamoyltransferase complex ATPase subunit type 1 TsaE [Alphaproteobacteria bacterium]
MSEPLVAPLLARVRVRTPSETETVAQALAAQARAGDVIALRGTLGAGKTSFARAFIRALCGDAISVPSPTFTLLQVYEDAPVPIYHYDLYRIEEAEEAWELGLEDALSDGICLIEWPERAGPLLPEDHLRLELAFAEQDVDARWLSFHGAPEAWLERILAAAGAWRRPLSTSFLAAESWAEAERAVLSADASFRSYDRLCRNSERRVLMDAPPPQEDVHPFLQIDEILRAHGLSAPQVFAADADNGFVLLEDLGDATFTRRLADGADETALYELAVDALVALHRAWHADPDRSVPPYDDDRLLDEAALLVDWYLPELSGHPTPSSERQTYLELWRQSFAAARAVPETLVLRDYHVDNLIELPGREGVRRCGLLDFQDAVRGPLTYDLVSLLEDARRDVPQHLQQAMTSRYLNAVSAFLDIDEEAFRASAAILAAQRSAKIIGIFTRLWRRDGKDQYLRHIPRVWRWLEGDLAHPVLADIKRWFDLAIPPAERATPGPRP